MYAVAPSGAKGVGMSYQRDGRNLVGHPTALNEKWGGHMPLSKQDKPPVLTDFPCSKPQEVDAAAEGASPVVTAVPCEDMLTGRSAARRQDP